MQKVLIFSGTTEGRELAETLSEVGIFCEVCVATEYGKEVMEPGDNIRVHPGRLDEAAMQSLMREGKFLAVVDATHPYAVEVSEHIRKSAGDTGLSCLRLKRDTVTERREAEQLKNLLYVDNTSECIRQLKEIEGNILLTTGSKELASYAAVEELKGRLYVRVLPGIESLTICQEQGITGKQVIAMQGPFSRELNEALIRQYQIAVLVTKESGHAGGFLEKVEAAGCVGIPVIVIANPDRTKGDTREAVLEEISRLSGVPQEEFRRSRATSEKSGVPQEEFRRSQTVIGKPGVLNSGELNGNLTAAQSGELNSKLQIALVGLGMGDTRLLTKEAEQAVREADYLFGAKRLLESVPGELNQRAVRRASYLAEEILPCMEEVLEELSRLSGGPQTAKAAVLFSGDTGFFSGAQKLYGALMEALTDGRLRGEVRICPGISSISYLAAKAGMSWQDAKIVSVHGRTANVTAEVQREPQVFLLVSGVRDMQKLGRQLVEAGLEQVRITVGYQMTYPGEQIYVLTPEECTKLAAEGLYACMIENPGAKKWKLAPGLSDDSFLRDKVPMTKEEVREVSLCKLGLHRNAVLYDVGSGTGSIAVEAARLSDTIQVYAIEKKELALSLIGENCKKMNAENVWIVAGEAPECLLSLPAPTHAFIGGSGGNLREILACLYQKNPTMRVVLNAITLETLAEITGLLRELPVCKEEIVQMQVSRAKVAGSYHLMQAENPVYIVSFCFREK